MMGRRFARAARAIGLAIVLATAGLSTGSRAQDIAMPCDAFIRNADGSWATMRDVPIGGMGRKLVLRQGSELRPGAAILSVDFAALLDRQCPSVSVAVPDPAPLPAPASEPKVELSRYADARGNIDIQKLTCGQLADTSPQDADFLGALYIGWYNGLAKQNAISVMRIKDVIRDLVVHCRANRDQRVTQAIDFTRKRQAR